MSAQKSRPNQFHSSPQSKSKKHSCCLCCFAGNSSEPSSEIYLDRGVEDTDLLVEKMVVQRVPVRLFATEEDYRKIEAERSERESYQSPRPFAKYYSTIPKTDIKTASTTKMRPMEQSAISLHNVEVEVLAEKFPFRGKKGESSGKKPTNADEVNNLSYLHTLDSKDVPREPCPVNPPKKLITGAVTNMPPHWGNPRNSSEEKKIAPATNMQAGGRDIRKELTPEMKDTLLMLGSAKKPGNYRLQKHLSQKRKNKKVTNDESSVASKLC